MRWLRWPISNLFSEIIHHIIISIAKWLLSHLKISGYFVKGVLGSDVSDKANNFFVYLPVMGLINNMFSKKIQKIRMNTVVVDLDTYLSKRTKRVKGHWWHRRPLSYASCMNNLNYIHRYLCHTHYCVYKDYLGNELFESWSINTGLEDKKG